MTPDTTTPPAGQGWAQIAGPTAAGHLRARLRWTLIGFLVTIIEFVMAIIIAPEGAWADLGAAQAAIVIATPMGLAIWHHHAAKLAAAAFVGIPRQSIHRLSMRSTLNFTQSVRSIRTSTNDGDS